MSARVFAVASIALCGACGVLLDVGSYSAVSCVSNCEGDAAVEASAPFEAGGPFGRDAGGRTEEDAGGATDASLDPRGTDPTPATTDPSACNNPPSCPAGRFRVVARVLGDAGSRGLESDPSGVDVRAGQTASACFLPNPKMRVRTTSGVASFSGVSCKDGNTGIEDCDFNLAAPVCVVGTF